MESEGKRNEPKTFICSILPTWPLSWLQVDTNYKKGWKATNPKRFFLITFLTSEVITSENQRLKGEEKKAKMRKLLLCDISSTWHLSSLYSAQNCDSIIFSRFSSSDNWNAVKIGSVLKNKNISMEGIPAKLVISYLNTKISVIFFVFFNVTFKVFRVLNLIEI